ncbi:MAG TPA: hypothetical protein VLA06_07395 [Woeseiaceae bacterium]|jgi:hypothetical protein|nr:hypothetical protein [Woeseiaceae bacterium]
MTDFVDDKPTTSFWVFSGAALVWNLIGLVFYYGQVTMAPETAATLTAAQQEFFATTPTWATAAHAIGVTAGVLGSLLLLFRKALATPVFALSLLGVLAQDLHAFVLSDALEVFGGANALILPAVVLVVAVALVWYSNSSKQKGWLS